MLSIEECKKVLEKNGEKYTDNEIKAIRDFLYKMAKIVDEAYIAKKINNGKEQQ